MSTTLRVGTWNLLHGFDLRSGRVELAAVADVVAALELDVLATKLGWTGVYGPALLGDPIRDWDAAGSGPDPGGPAYGIGLLSPHPLTDIRRLALPGGAQRRRVRHRLLPPLSREPRTV